MKHKMPICAAAMLLAASQSGQAAISLGFDDGFADGWSGETTNLESEIETVDLYTETNSRFSLPGGGMAQIDTHPDTKDASNIYAVDLFLQLSLPSDATTLVFDFAWQITDPDFDFVEAKLSEVGVGTYIDLFSGLSGDSNSGTGRSVDISSLAGMNVELGFHVEDFDDSRDWLKVGNITINQSTNEAPLPGSAALLAFGLLGFAGRRSASPAGRDRLVGGRQ